MRQIEVATEYSPLPKPSERFQPNCYSWLTTPQPEPLHVKEQLPAGDREHLLRMWEETDRQISSQRYPDQDDFKNKERQMGKLLHSSELVRRIQKLNPNLIVENSKAVKGSAAFYLVDERGKNYTNASFPLGWVTEFTIIKVDTADLPVEPQYGWRTVLVRLLKFGAITWQQVLDTFGDVKFSDSRGLHWHHNVSAYRY